METVRLTCGLTRSMLGSGVTVVTTALTASIAPSTDGLTGIMTVTVAAATTLAAGNVITGTGVTPNSFILEQLTSTETGGTLGGKGTYRINNSQTVGSEAITADNTGPWVYKDSPYATFQASVDGTSGAQTATVVIEVSNDGLHPCGTVAGTITLNGTLTSSDGFATTSSWKFVRARATAISGTGAKVTCLMGV